MGFFSPHFSQICQGSVNLVYLFKEPTFCVIDSFIYFFVSISLISALIFIISLILFWNLLVPFPDGRACLPATVASFVY
jgi:hypothetical protein